MAPRNTLANLSYTVDSASEDEMARDDLNAFPTPDSNTENKAPASRSRAKAATKVKAAPAPKATEKTKTTARRASGGSVLGAKKAGVTKKAGTRGRKPLAEKKADVSDTEEVDEFDGEDEMAPAEVVKPAPKRGRPAKAKKAPEEEETVDEMMENVARAKKTRKAANADTPAKAVPKAKKATKSKAAKAAPEAEPEPVVEEMIPETQPAHDEPEPMDIEDSIEVDEIPETMPPPPRPIGRRAQQPPGISRQPSAGPRRAGSVSDAERDPASRRKLGELTKKLEAMTVKYANLKDAVSSSKESNFDQLKKRTEQVAKDQDAVIKALKQQLSEVQSRTSEVTAMKKEMAKLKEDNARLTTENKNVRKELATSQNENKSLTTKLAAARSVPQPEVKTLPGSAMKPRSTGVVLPGAAEAAKEAQLKQQKIELYSDLTDLVIVGAKKGEDGEDVYDCLQTGRNGTLHFQLSMPDGDGMAEDAEFIYLPHLDDQRDKELLELLPDYLTEEIGFPRSHVAKFYRKVLDSMAKKIEVVEDE